MKKINELKENNRKSIIDRIKQIKIDNPGKFDHLPDPVEGSPIRNWTDDEIKKMDEKIKQRLEDINNTKKSE